MDWIGRATRGGKTDRLTKKKSIYHSHRKNNEREHTEKEKDPWMIEGKNGENRENPWIEGMTNRKRKIMTSITTSGRERTREGKKKR